MSKTILIIFFFSINIIKKISHYYMVKIMPLFKIKYKLFFISLLSIFLSIDAPRLLADQSPLEKISLEGYYVKDKLVNYYSDQEISNFLNDAEYIEIGTNQNLSQFN